jgi:hypothetical protein
MKMFIVNEEKEYKILKVEPNQEAAFKKEFGDKVLVEGKNLGELINNFQQLNAEKIHFNPTISSFGKVTKDEDETRRTHRQKM